MIVSNPVWWSFNHNSPLNSTHMHHCMHCEACTCCWQQVTSSISGRNQTKTQHSWNCSSGLGFWTSVSKIVQIKLECVTKRARRTSQPHFYTILCKKPCDHARKHNDSLPFPPMLLGWGGSPTASYNVAPQRKQEERWILASFFINLPKLWHESWNPMPNRQLVSICAF